MSPLKFKNPKNNKTFERISKRIKPHTRLSVEIHFVLIDKLFERHPPKTKKKHNEHHDFVDAVMVDINKAIAKYRITKRNKLKK